MKAGARLLPNGDLRQITADRQNGRTKPFDESEMISTKRRLRAAPRQARRIFGIADRPNSDSSMKFRDDRARQSADRQNKAIRRKRSKFNAAAARTHKARRPGQFWQNNPTGITAMISTPAPARAQMPDTNRAMITMVTTCMVPWHATAKKKLFIMRPILSPSGAGLGSSRQTRRLVGNR